MSTTRTIRNKNYINLLRYKLLRRDAEEHLLRVSSGPFVTRLMHREHTRPLTRGECRTADRPCPWVGCRWHLMFEVVGEELVFTSTLPIEDMRETCVLDVADRKGQTMQEVADVMHLSRQRIKQIEDVIIGKFQEAFSDP